MVMVKIFNVETVSTELPLKILSAGEHILGRESFSNCRDRKISRKHAVITVQDDKVTLTSVHVNPCYFVSEESPKVQILTQDVPHKLSDGDKFAFIPDFWYRIQIVKDDPDVPNDKLDIANFHDTSNPTIPLSINDSAVTIRASGSKIPDTSSPLKRCLQELNSGEPKKLKTIHQSLDQLLENIKEIENQEFTKENEKVEQKLVNSDNNELFRRKDISDSDENDSDVDMTPEVTRDSEVVKTEEIKKTETENKDPDEDNSDNKGDELGSADDRSDVLKEPIDSNVDSEVVFTRSDTGQEIEDDLRLTMNAQGDIEVPIDNNEENTNLDDENKRDGSTSEESMDKKLRREQCWYGESCYRKNANHREEFSHPGDADYNLNADVDRPECSYGGQCYRTNQQHRRHYKHPTPQPAPKPSTMRAKRRRTATSRNEDSESDSEDSQEDEPFSGEDSSSENYDPNDTDSDYSDSERMKDIEEDEEIGAMVKEAKKFLRRKRKE